MNSRGLALESLACLTVATTQWSLRSCAKMHIPEYLCGVFVKIKSSSGDFSRCLTFECLAASTSCVGLKESHTDLRLSNAEVNQTQFRSPTSSSSFGSKFDNVLMRVRSQHKQMEVYTIQ